MIMLMVQLDNHTLVNILENTLNYIKNYFWQNGKKKWLVYFNPWKLYLCQHNMESSYWIQTTNSWKNLWLVGKVKKE